VSSGGQISAESEGDVESWEPRGFLRAIDYREARLANGFLRCHPERWFPGFAERWAPLISTLGCEVRIGEIKPTMVLPDDTWLCFRGTLDDESMVVALDRQTAELLIQEVVPNISGPLQTDLVIEYLVQRFMAVLGMSQTASETAGALIFNGRCSPSEVSLIAAVRLSFSLNSAQCSLIVALGQEAVDRMDRLWRRQVHSSVRSAQEAGLLRFELAQLGVPPHLLSEYVSKGTVVDLEVPASDSLTLRVGSKLFMPARMIQIDGKLGCQIVSGSAANLPVAEGTSRLSIEIASLPVEPSVLAELGQVGAILNTGRALDGRVTLNINQEKIADARLCVYQGRYAVEVE
jgi:flagellar motor switch/type III secretory pathway protein FliN